jgi:hypothetical protein
MLFLFFGQVVAEASFNSPAPIASIPMLPAEQV